MNISFTTTACCRPELLRKTYNSFYENIKGIDFSKITLYINIDPLPDVKNRDETLEVAKKYFKNVIYRFPETPNFTSAINWLWSNADTDYIFHLEDDWILTSPVHIEDIVNRFDENEVMEVALRAYPYEYKKLCLSPSFWRKSLYKRFAGHLDENKNPEVQLRVKGISPDNISCIGEYPIVKDIGRGWLSDSKFKRPITKSVFTSWEKK